MSKASLMNSWFPIGIFIEFANIRRNLLCSSLFSCSLQTLVLHLLKPFITSRCVFSDHADKKHVCPQRSFVQSNPPVRDQNVSFTGHFVANPATNFINRHSLMLCCHLKKTINEPTPPWSAVPFCVLSFSVPHCKRTKTIAASA